MALMGNGMAWNPKRATKGRIAENLTEELFRELDFHVYPYGWEKTVPGLAKILGRNKKRIGVQKSIAYSPDFVVHHEEKGTFFIEVKYRSNSSLKRKDAANYHEDTLFVLFSQKMIQCISQNELTSGEELTEKYQRKFMLGSRSEFGFDKNDKEKIREYCEHAISFFGEN